MKSLTTGLLIVSTCLKRINTCNGKIAWQWRRKQKNKSRLNPENGSTAFYEVWKFDHIISLLRSIEIIVPFFLLLLLLNGNKHDDPPFTSTFKLLIKISPLNERERISSLTKHAQTKGATTKTTTRTTTPPLPAIVGHASEWLPPWYMALAARRLVLGSISITVLINGSLSLWSRPFSRGFMSCRKWWWWSSSDMHRTVNVDVVDSSDPPNLLFRVPRVHTVDTAWRILDVAYLIILCLLPLLRHSWPT